MMPVRPEGRPKSSTRRSGSVAAVLFGLTATLRVSMERAAGGDR